MLNPPIEVVRTIRWPDSGLVLPASDESRRFRVTEVREVIERGDDGQIKYRVELAGPYLTRDGQEHARGHGERLWYRQLPRGRQPASFDRTWPQLPLSVAQQLAGEPALRALLAGHPAGASS